MKTESTPNRKRSVQELLADRQKELQHDLELTEHKLKVAQENVRFFRHQQAMMQQDLEQVNKDLLEELVRTYRKLRERVQANQCNPVKRPARFLGTCTMTDCQQQANQCYRSFLQRSLGDSKGTTKKGVSFQTCWRIP